MAVQSIVVTVGQALSNGEFSVTAANGDDQTAHLATAVAALAAYDTLAATVVSTLATLVADGASPTQAHVTAVNNAYTALKASYVTLKADVNAISLSGNFTVLIDLAVVTSRNAVLAAWKAVLQTLAGSGTVIAK